MDACIAYLYGVRYKNISVIKIADTRISKSVLISGMSSRERSLEKAAPSAPPGDPYRDSESYDVSVSNAV